MYISDVIAEVKRYYPHDHDEREFYMWCNEVSALLHRRCENAEKKYNPIRLICYRGEVFIEPEQGYIRTSCCKFSKGDILNVRAFSQGTLNMLFERLPLSAVEYDMSGYLMRVPGGALAGAKRGFRECMITRAVTDETICCEPHDMMYVDYILAKISLFQRDYKTYMHHIKAFGSRLSEYKSQSRAGTPDVFVN